MINVEGYTCTVSTHPILIIDVSQIAKIAQIACIEWITTD